MWFTLWVWCCNYQREEFWGLVKNSILWGMTIKTSSKIFGPYLRQHEICVTGTEESVPLHLNDSRSLGKASCCPKQNVCSGTMQIQCRTIDFMQSVHFYHRQLVGDGTWSAKNSTPRGLDEECLSRRLLQRRQP